MKYFLNAFKLLAVLAMGTVLNSSCCHGDCCEDGDCSEEDIKITQSNGTANFVVKNITTGEERSGSAIVIGNTNRLAISEGDELELSYIPSKDYKDYTFKVSFRICGNDVSAARSANGSYTATYTIPNVSVGDYTLSCEANGESRNSRYQETGYVYAQVVKNSTQVADAGTFALKNISSGKDIVLGHGISVYIGEESTIADCYGGDTLLVKFTPKAEYTSYKFKVSVPEYKQINDSLFVVPTEETSDDKYRGKEISLNASCTADGKTLSAKEEGSFSYRSYFAYNVEWNLTLSEDLMRFVQPEFTSIDVDGKETTKLLTDEDLKRRVFAYYLDEEGYSHLIDEMEETPEEGWTLEERSVSYEYSEPVKFTRRNSTLKAQVRYKRKDGAELTDTNVDFSRSLDWYASGYINIGITITIGSDTPTIEKLQKYLDDCCEAIDEMIISIDRNGHISEKKK